MVSKKILVIEDNEDILDLMQMILEGAGFDVVASEEVNVLKNLYMIQPDLILMDNLLNEGLGSEFCRQLKNNPETSGFKVVLISANTDLDRMTAASGADGFLAKPFDIGELVEIAERFTDI